MSKIGFWETLFDDNISWREAPAINEAHDAIDAMRTANLSSSFSSSEQLQKLFALDRAQAVQIERMSACIDVMTELLIESGALDRNALSARVHERLTAFEAAKAQEKQVGPLAQCTRCFKAVPAPRTQVTEGGIVCDRCYYG